MSHAHSAICSIGAMLRVMMVGVMAALMMWSPWLNGKKRVTAVGGGEYDAGARRMLLRTVPIPDDPIKTAAILGRDFDAGACSHTKGMSQITAFGNPPNASLH